jgi:TolC family type I secretion outer membrane protein
VGGSSRAPAFSAAANCFAPGAAGCVVRRAIGASTALVPLAALLLVTLSNPVNAYESIAGALATSYMGNPTLNAERARQRATDENVPQALSGWRPTVSVNGDVGAAWNDSSITRPTNTTPAGVAVTLTQPVFRGFRTVSATAQAEALVSAGRQDLLTVEQQVLLDAATAYMNVIRDRNVLALRAKNVEVLKEQLRASQTRFEVGEITRTDVAQSRASLAQAQSNYAAAEANLAASVANFLRIIGHAPGTLRFPEISPLVPKTLDRALALSEQINPTILAAAFNEEAARHNIDLIKGGLLPEVSFNAQYTYNHEPSANVDWSDQATVFGQVQIPLYEGGLIYSQVRQAKQVDSQRRLEVIDVRRQVREQVTQTWNNLKAAESVIASSKIQVEANRLALEGVRQEALVGSRTTLDVLDAEQVFVDSQVLLATAERDRIVSAYQLIAATGHMTARNLNLDVIYYDVRQNYLDVRYKWIGTNVNTVD